MYSCVSFCFFFFVLGLKALSTSARFAVFSERWAEVGESEKEEYRKRAKEVPLSESDRDRQWNANLRKMKCLVKLF